MEESKSPEPITYMFNNIENNKHLWLSLRQVETGYKKNHNVHLIPTIAEIL